MSVSVTPKAAAQIRKALAKRGGGVGLRVAVKTSGCSGYAYALEFADEAAAIRRFDFAAAVLMDNRPQALITEFLVQSDRRTVFEHHIESDCQSVFVSEPARSSHE